jgi:hypothetical protein
VAFHPYGVALTSLQSHLEPAWLSGSFGKRPNRYRSAQPRAGRPKPGWRCSRACRMDDFGVCMPATFSLFFKALCSVGCAHVYRNHLTEIRTVRQIAVKPNSDAHCHFAILFDASYIAFLLSQTFCQATIILPDGADGSRRTWKSSRGRAGNIAVVHHGSFISDRLKALGELGAVRLTRASAVTGDRVVTAHTAPLPSRCPRGRSPLHLGVTQPDPSGSAAAAGPRTRLTEAPFIVSRRGRCEPTHATIWSWLFAAIACGAHVSSMWVYV